MGVLEEYRYYHTLKRISKDYMTPERIRRSAERDPVLSYEETLEMAYDNLQAEAADAIRGKRAPRLPEKKVETVAVEAIVKGEQK